MSEEGAEARRPASPRRAARALACEVSWEVCNPIGGIYTVLRSKAPIMVERWGHRYFLVGPYVPRHADLEFERLRVSGWLALALEDVASQGLRVHHGRWLVPGRPRLLLLEPSLDEAGLATVRRRATDELGLDTGARGRLMDDTFAFGERVRLLLEAITRHYLASGSPGSRRVIAHFHEWLGSLALPLLRHDDVPLATVFTTHATQVGRYAASNEEDFYELLSHLDGDERAAHYGIRTSHQIERACARACDVLTTVSPITAEECTHLLGRTPDLLTPNGLNLARYDLGADFQTVHGQNKQALHEFTMAHFFPSQAFDLDRTLYFFTSGRFEPRNKGFDLCLEAMARLNAELRASQLGVTVVFFIVTETPTRSIDPVALHSRGVLDELREVSERLTAGVAESLFQRGAAGGRLRLDDLVDEYWGLRFRRTQHALRSGRPPLVTTHLLENESGDPVLAQIRALQLCNEPDDPVKVVYHPEFISPVNPLWGIEYDQFVRGCHLGIFPSVYEPWGYTPLECIAMGVPAVTSDLAGFGRYVADAYPDHDEWGLAVLKRRGRSFHDVAAELSAKLLAFCRLDRRGRIALRNDVESHSREFGWSNLGQAYREAHDRALAARY